MIACTAQAEYDCEPRKACSDRMQYEDLGQVMDGRIVQAGIADPKAIRSGNFWSKKKIHT